MGLKIIISSAVELQEKSAVKNRLRDMEARKIIKIDEIYDCNERGTFWNKQSKQEEINNFISHADWFICLIPNYYVGQMTCGELEYVIDKKLNGAPVQISVFHPKSFFDKKDTQPIPEDGVSFELLNQKFKNKKVPFALLKKMAEKKLKSNLGNYDVPFNDNDEEDLCLQVEEEFKKAYNDKAFWSQHLGYFTQKGIDITAPQLFYDKERASREWGFIDDRENYIWRNSVDGELQQKIKNESAKFLFITGKPTSGKTRALYECLHDTLSNEEVVIVKYNNIKSICENLETEISQKDKDNNLPQRFRDNNYYFVCDQISDVFKLAQVSDEMRLSFLKTIREHDNCKLLATGTENTLHDFVNDSNDFISPFRDSDIDGNSCLINIPSITKDIDSQEILATLRQRHNISDGETMGDFIKELKTQKKTIVKSIYKKAEENPYLPSLLKSIQLTLTYRNITPLLLPINTLRKYCTDDSAAVFKQKSIECLNFLIKKNVLKVSDTESPEKEITSFPKKHFTESQYCVNTIIDDEEYKEYIPQRYTFMVNEWVWDYLEEESVRNPDTAILYNLYEMEDLRNAMPIFFESYPHASTLRRLVSRVPVQRDWQAKQDDETRKRMAWNYAKGILNNFDTTQEPAAELTTLFNILIGRAESITEVDEILNLMNKRHIESNESTIGEMYHFAKHLDKDSDEFNKFIGTVNSLYKKLQAEAYRKGCTNTHTIFYIASWRIKLFSDNYDKAFAFAFNALHTVTYKGKHGDELKGKEAVKFINGQNNSKEKSSLDKMMATLAFSCKTQNDVMKLINCLTTYCIEPTSFVLHKIATVLGNVDAVEMIIDRILPSVEEKTTKRALYERMICCFIQHMPDFQQSVYLYNKWKKDLKIEDHNTRMVSLCLKNCKKEEFQSAIAFIYNMPNEAINGITYNLLISIAPNPEEVVYLLNRMKDSDIDEYTLSNCLKCIDIINQKNYRKNAYIHPTQIFIMAYELINHPKLKFVRNQAACIQRLYKLVFDKYQDAYVSRIAGARMETLKYNEFINSTRINSYRNFSEAYTEIYMPARHQYMTRQGTFKPDIFNSLCAKYYKDQIDGKLSKQENAEKYAEQMQEDIQKLLTKERGASIIQDEHFFLNYHIKFLGEPLFTDDEKAMSPLFLDWFKMRVGNYNPYNLSILSRYINYFFNLPDTSAEGKWLKSMTLYSTYKNYFKDNNVEFTPDDLVFVNMFKIANQHQDKVTCLKFIDQELNDYKVKWTLKLNYYIKENEKYHHFIYGDTHTQPYNRQEDNIEKILKACQTEQILSVLKQEIGIEGFVTPTVLNCALNRYRDFHRKHNNTIRDFITSSTDFMPKATKNFNLTYLADRFIKSKNPDKESKKILERIKKHTTNIKNREELTTVLNKLCKQLDDEQICDIINFITSNNLQNSLTLTGKTFMALLVKDKTERMRWLNGIKELEDISENVFGMLARENVIAQTDMDLSQTYFRKWIHIYEDIYGDKNAIANIFNKIQSAKKIRKDNTPDKWNTLGMHLKNEINFLSIVRSHFEKETGKRQLNDLYIYIKDLNKLETLDIIADIIQLYKYEPKYFKPENFNKTVTFEDVVTLLNIHNKNEDWNLLHDNILLGMKEAIA